MQGKKAVVHSMSPIGILFVLSNKFEPLNVSGNNCPHKLSGVLVLEKPTGMLFWNGLLKNGGAL